MNETFVLKHKSLFTGPPSARATRRSNKKMDSISETAEDSIVENKRLSRVRETEGVPRGRRGSGTLTNSRSSSPIGSGDESEADQSRSRSRKKSGRTGTGTEADSAPASPAPSSSHENTNEDMDEWKKSAYNIINELKAHKFADKVFPALRKSEPDKKLPILQEMDLSIIFKNVESNAIKTNADLHHAIHLLFLNLVMSFGSHTEVRFGL